MPGREEAPDAAALGSAVVRCENCGEETLHRILRIDRRGGGGVSGIARCRVCRWTHPFASLAAPRARVEVVVSAGATSARRGLELAEGVRLRVGEPVPGLALPATVTRLDRRDGKAGTEASAREVATVWAIEDGHRFVRVAVIDGARSSTERMPTVPGTRIEVGASLRLRSGPVTVVGLRARHRTWRRPGDGFPAEEVTVVYGRRTVSPPAGRSPWSRVRGTPSSRASSISRSARSRSSPGERRKRTAPRARTAAGGATASHSSSS